MLNVSLVCQSQYEVGKDKGDGTKWDDKNRIAKFIANTSNKVSAPSPSSNTESSSNNDDFDWDK